MRSGRSKTASTLLGKDLTKRYGDRPLWSGLSFRADPGTATAVTGASGAGKTTLINCIGLLEEPDSGSLTFGDLELTRLQPRKRQSYFRHTVGFLFQSYGLISSWNVDDNLNVALEYSDLSTKQRSHAKSEALDRVGLDGFLRAKIFTLSGGEQQRVALARLLLKDPAVVLADEPTAALDQANAQIVIDILQDFRSRDRVVIVSTHDPVLAESCDSQILLSTEAESTAGALGLHGAPADRDKSPAIIFGTM